MLRSPSYDPDLRRRRLIVLAIVATLLLISAVTYALLTRGEPHSAPPSTPPAITAPEVVSGPSGMLDDGTLPELPPVTDPEEFAEVVAHAIFDWDTSSLAPRAAYLQRIATVADPTGESSPGLISDVDAYLPPFNPRLRGRLGRDIPRADPEYAPDKQRIRASTPTAFTYEVSFCFHRFSPPPFPVKDLFLRDNTR